MVSIVKVNKFGTSSVISDQPADSYEAEEEILTKHRRDTQLRRQQQRQKELEEERKPVVSETESRDQIKGKINHYVQTKNLITKMEYENKLLLKHIQEYAKAHNQTKWLQTLQSNIEVIKPGHPQSFTQFNVLRLKRVW
jgi:hypothetical protein